MPSALKYLALFQVLLTLSIFIYYVNTYVYKYISGIACFRVSCDTGNKKNENMHTGELSREMSVHRVCGKSCCVYSKEKKQ